MDTIELRQNMNMNDFYAAPESVDRRDAALSISDVDVIWNRDPQRAFLEWTYRMNDIPQLLDQDVEFAKQITKRLIDTRRVPSDVACDLETLIESFQSGHCGVSVWQIRARNALLRNRLLTVHTVRLSNEERSIALRAEAEAARKWAPSTAKRNK